MNQTLKSFLLFKFELLISSSPPQNKFQWNCYKYQNWVEWGRGGLKNSPFFQHIINTAWLATDRSKLAAHPCRDANLISLRCDFWRLAHWQWAMRWSSKYHAAGGRVTLIPLKHHHKITSPCHIVPGDSNILGPITWPGPAGVTIDTGSHTIETGSNDIVKGSTPNSPLITLRNEGGLHNKTQAFSWALFLLNSVLNFYETLF